MRAVRNLPPLYRVDEVKALFEFILDDVKVVLDPKLLHRPGGLVLVDIDHLLAPCSETVDRTLLEVSLERALDVTPDLVPVSPRLLLAIDHHLLGVLGDQLRGLEPHRALPDRLDL